MAAPIRQISALAVTAFVVAMPQTAWAQAKDAADTPSQDSTNADAASDTTIVVTAMRRGTALQDTPISISALDAKSLSQIGATQFEDFFQQVPGLTEVGAGPGNKRYAIRGIQAAGEPQVGLYYDEIPVVGVVASTLDTGAAQPDLDLFDVDRVEVLRGPQGTLYGSGSMGGTLRIISKRPNLLETEGELQGDVHMVTDEGNLSYNANGMINLPLVNDELGLRVVVNHRYDAGWIDDPIKDINGTNSVKETGVRASLRFQPSKDWTFDLIGYYQDTKVADRFEIFPEQPWVVDYPALTDTKWVGAHFLLAPTFDKFKAANLIVNHKMGGVNLDLIGSYQDRTYNLFLDSTRPNIYSIFNSILGSNCDETNYFTCFPAPFNFLSVAGYADLDNVKAWSGEARLSSDDKGPFQWTIGTFYRYRNNYHAGELNTPSASSDIPYVKDDNPAGIALVDPFYFQRNTVKTEEFAVFGEATYEIVHGLKATAGARWFEATRDLTQELVVPFSPTDPVGFYPPAHSHESKPLFKFALSYDVTRDILLYAQAAQGYRIGGPNFPVAFAAAVPDPYKADSLWDYEFGWKTSWLSNHLTFNGSLFLMDWSNIQQLTTDPTGAFSLITNGGSAVAKGFELELDATPVRGLEVGAGVSYTDAHLTGAQPIVPIPDNQTFAGDFFPYVPRWTTNVDVTYNFQALGRNSFIRGDFVSQSSRTTGFNPINPNYYKVPGYTLTNLRAGIDVTDKVKFSIYCNNIFNNFAIQSATYGRGSPLQVGVATPRTIGAQLGVTF